MPSPLMEAVARGDEKLLEEVLSEHLDPACEDATGSLVADLEAALVKAAAFGQPACVSRLLAEGVDIDCRNADGDSPLSAAAANGHMDVVELLLFCDADINSQSDAKRTPLHLAAWHHHTSIVRHLLSNHCDVTTKDQYGDTALMLTTRRGSHQLVEEILRFDVQVDQSSCEGDTALMYASRYGHVKCASLLLQAGAGVNLQNIWGNTPLLYATAFNHPLVADLHLRSGCDVSLADKYGRTALHNAAKNNLARCCEVILREGSISVDCQDCYENTPLLEALLYDSFDAACLLISAGCSLHRIGKTTLVGLHRPYNALDVALYRSQLVTARLLYEAGGRVSQISRDINVHLRNEARQDILDWVNERTSNPRSLLASCRLVIRGRLEGRVLLTVHLLELPSTLKDCLLLKNET